MLHSFFFFFFFKQKTAYEMRISDWSSDVCSSDLEREERARQRQRHHAAEVLEDARQLADHRRAVLLDLVGGVDERLVHALQLAVAAHRHETATVLVLLDHVALGDGDLELGRLADLDVVRSEEHTSELQSLL